MSYRILGVGPGVFIIIALWICAFALAVVFSKAKRPISFLSSGFIILAFLITTIIVCIPRGSEPPEQELEFLKPDYLIIWRFALLVFLFLSSIAGVVFMLTEHWAVSMSAKPLKKVVRKTVVCEEK